VPELRISLTEDEYELLLKAKGSKTWKQWLLDIAMEQVEPESMAVREINEVFKVLREKLLVYKEKGELVGVVDRMRVVCIMLMRIKDEEKLAAAIDALTEALDGAIARLSKILKA